MQSYDFIVIGAGMAGTSTSFFLADFGSVLLLERETQPGYHSTGRSAALYSEAYGNAIIRALTTASKSFFRKPPTGFTDNDILTPRGTLFIGREDQLKSLDVLQKEASFLVNSIQRLTGKEACKLIPSLRIDYVAGAVFEPEAMDIDVNSLHQGFLKGTRTKGGTILNNAEVKNIQKRQDLWQVSCGAETFQSPKIINAAGAWCDVVAALAGAKKINLVPKRRSGFLFEPPINTDINTWPVCVDIDEKFYFKPESGKLMGSPADETPIGPCDVQPEELDIAIAVDRIQKASNFSITQIKHRWAGLRSFVSDKTPVVGPDPELEGFFWCAGQGGYGIQTAPTMGQITAALSIGESVPETLFSGGFNLDSLSPARIKKNP